MWDERYGQGGFIYGDQPNDFLAEVAGHIPPGPVLALAEGQGRNAVWLAERGHAVTAVDLSPVGLAKAQELAAARGVTLTTIVADLADFDLGVDAWSGITSIWCHLPSALRARVHAAVVRALKPGGVLVLEAYTPAQIAHGTGGPKDPDMLPTADALRAELIGLDLEILVERERDVEEGAFHGGRSAVVQCLARRPR
ncbi:MAG: class I SAM-dependent methyltransferase [Myxococcota bacterium]